MEINKQAMTYLKKGQPDQCNHTLMRAEKKLHMYEASADFVENDQYYNAASITYNNMGCYHQK